MKSKIVKILLIIVIVYVAFVAISSLGGVMDSLLSNHNQSIDNYTNNSSDGDNLKNASIEDNVTIDIGNAGILVANFKNCIILNKEKIPDGYVYKNSSFEEFRKLNWVNATEYILVDTSGNKEKVIVWKYLIDSDSANGTDIGDMPPGNLSGYYFTDYCSDDSCVYGIIVCNNTNLCLNATDLFINILGFSEDDLPTWYFNELTANSYSHNKNNNMNHYGGVDTSPYALDENSYYDYYDYGDNLDIDEYMDNEGYE